MGLFLIKINDIHLKILRYGEYLTKCDEKIFSMQYEELRNNEVSVLNAMKYETIQRVHLRNTLVDIDISLQFLYTLKYLTNKEKYIRHAYFYFVETYKIFL